MEFSKVLLAVDGSEHSGRAVQAAAAIGKAFDSQVRIVHAVPTFGEYTGKEGLFGPIVEDLREAGKGILGQAEGILKRAGLSPTHRLIEGSPLDVILQEAEAWRPNLIVIGSRGISVSDRYALGSVSFRVGLLAPCSTLIVRSQAKFDRILVALDRSEAASAAVEWAADLAKRMRASLSLLLVIDSDPNQVAFTVSRGYVEPFLKKTETRLKELGLPPTRIIKYGDPPSEIVNQAGKGGQDLVVLGAKGVKDSSIFTLGGVTMRVIESAPISVAVVRTKGEGGV